jgi:superoxide dismutase, Cu-Zn family
MRCLLLSIAASLLATTTAFAQQPASSASEKSSPPVTAEMKNAKGKSVGTVELRQLLNGVLITADLKDLPPGPLGFHIHERGKCDAPDFKSAGGHFNPTKAEHGFDTRGGPHIGDLPNIHVGKDGTAKAEFFSAQLSLKSATVAASGSAATGAGAGTASGGAAVAGPFSLVDGEGTALMVHAATDDHADMDSAGGRLACGVISGNR